MRNNSWIIRNAALVLPEMGILNADLGILDGVVSTIAKHINSLEGVQEYDAEGCYVFPGFIDPHVHLGNFNHFEDDCMTETISAACGGVTTVITYLKILRHRSQPDSYRLIFDEVCKQINELASVDVAMHCAISTPQHVEEISEYAAMGAPSFKFYLGYKGSPAALKRGAVGVEDWLVYQGFLEIACTGESAVACVHAENEELIRFFEKRISKPSKATFLEWAESRPNIAEAESVSRACYFAKSAGNPIYLVHISTRESLEIAKKEKGTKDVPVYVETCPHYLTMTKEDGNALKGATAKIIPPLRDRESLEALWQGIRDGTVDAVGTDHCALTMERKQNVWDGDPAFPGMETMLPLMITEAQRRGLELTRIAQVCSYNPAKIFGLLPRKGTLRPGADGDVVIVRCGVKERIRAAKLHSSSCFTPFENRPVTARVEATLLRGNLIYSRRANQLEEKLGESVLRRV